MAKCHRKLKEYTEALTLYHQALATDKVAPDATLSIGYTYEEQSKKKGCHQVVSAHMQTLPPHP